MSVTYKNEEDQIKSESARVAATFLPLYVFGNYSRHSRAANSTVPSESWVKFKFNQAFMVVLITCKNENPIKNESAREVTTLNINLQIDQGKITM